MLRAEIRRAVDVALAENGYPKSWYYWEGAKLHVLVRGLGAPPKPIHLPSGTSKKRLMQRLSSLPVNGDSRSPVPINVMGGKDDGYRQLDLEQAIRDAR